MNETKMLSLATELAQAKSKQDIIASLDIYHPKAEMIAPSFNSKSTGRVEIEKQLKILFGLFPNYSAELELHAFSQNVMLATAQISVTLNLPGKSCPHIQLPAFIEFHFFENYISKEVISLDVGTVCRMSGVRADELANAISSFKS